MATITPLDAVLGAEIRGVDVGAGVDDSLMRTLTDALYAHRVIVIRDQSLDTDAYLRFGRRWGDPIPHVLDHMRMPGYPDLMTVGNTEKRDEDSKIRNGAALWHTDQSYEKVPGERDDALFHHRPRARRRDAVLRHGHRLRQPRRGDPAADRRHRGRPQVRAGQAALRRAAVEPDHQRRAGSAGAAHLPSARHAPPDDRPQGALRARARGIRRQGDARRRGGGAARCAQGLTRSRSVTSIGTSTRWAISWCGTPCRQCTPRLPSTSPRRTRTHGCCGASAYADAPRFMRRRPESYARGRADSPVPAAPRGRSTGHPSVVLDPYRLNATRNASANPMNGTSNRLLPVQE